MNARMYHEELSLPACPNTADDGSVHSTVAVYSPAVTCHKVTAPGGAVAEANSSNSSSYKRNKIRHDHAAAVHFNESNNEYYENHQLCRQDVQELCWYTRFETRAFRKAANALARSVAYVEREQEIVQQQSNDAESSYKDILQRTFQACLDCSSASSSSSFEEMNEKQEQEEELHNNNSSSSILTGQDHATLCRRMSEYTERLGLERMAIRKLGDDRFARRNQICQMLLDLQKRLLLLSKSQEEEEEENNHHDDDASKHAEMFRACCQAISRPSRLFARELACAFLDDEGYSTP